MDQQKTFLRLFEGNQDRHLILYGNPSKGQKGKIENKMRLDDGPLTAEMARAHIAGDMSIGVSPVRADSTCLFGVLDIDWYDMPEDAVRAVADRLRTRCAAFRSKSRGLHVYIFMDAPIPAKKMNEYLMVLRKRLPKACFDKKHNRDVEVFPKATQTRVTPGDKPTSVNLPMKGQQRELAWLIDERGVKWAVDEMSGTSILTHIDDHCRIDANVVSEIAEQQTVLDSSDIGYQVPDDPAGRNDLLMRIAMSMQVRGWPDTEMDAEIRRLNGDENFHYLFADGPLTEKEIVNLLHSAKKRDKGSPTALHYRMVEKFNREWAMMAVEGQVEFLNVEDGACFNKGAFFDMTAPKTVQIGKNRVPVAKLWLMDPDRKEYRGIVIEAPEYDGPGFNVFAGWAVSPKEGDVSLWVDYVERIVCGGDKELAHWVMSYVADGAQRPWSLHPGTALALRGPQGGGKSFIGNMLARILKSAQVQEVTDSERMFERFNRGMFGSTFILAEESVFAGSKKQAGQLKAFITSPRWQYEQKFLASFTGKNVHRMIATTNDEQAVHLDDDDRRWTVVEVANMFDDPSSSEAREYWRPYWDLDPRVVLRYLFDYEVDRDLIGRPHITQAKRDDKIMSDPVLEVLHDIADSGIVPDDLDARGKLSVATLHRECRARGASHFDKSRTQGERAKKILGWRGTCRDAMHIKDYQRTVDGDGQPWMHPILDNGGHARGIDLLTLAEFRAAVSRRTGVDYGEGSWKPYKPPQIDISAPDPDAVEQVHSERQRAKYGEDTPF